MLTGFTEYFSSGDSAAPCTWDVKVAGNATQNALDSATQQQIISAQNSQDAQPSR